MGACSGAAGSGGVAGAGWAGAIVTQSDRFGKRGRYGFFLMIESDKKMEGQKINCQQAMRRSPAGAADLEQLRTAMRTAALH